MSDHNTRLSARRGRRAGHVTTCRLVRGAGRGMNHSSVEHLSRDVVHGQAAVRPVTSAPGPELEGHPKAHHTSQNVLGEDRGACVTGWGHRVLVGQAVERRGRHRPHPRRGGPRPDGLCGDRRRPVGQGALAPSAPTRGYDAGRKVNGRKRHVGVDTLGLLVVVTAASGRDREGGRLVLDRTRMVMPSIALVRADGGYAGRCVEFARRPDLLFLTRCAPRRDVLRAREAAGSAPAAAIVDPPTPLRPGAIRGR